MTLLNSMLDNGQAQASPPGLAAVALSHPVEAFKNPVLGFLGNPDASIRHLQDRLELINDNLKMLLLRAGIGTQYVATTAPDAVHVGQPRTA